MPMILRSVPTLWRGHHFQQMAVELPEIQGPATTAVSNPAIRVGGRPAAVRQAFGFHPCQDPIELFIRDVKSVMMALQLFRHKVEDLPSVLVVGEVDGQVLINGHLGKAALGWLHLKAEDLCKELSRGYFVLHRNNQVV